MMRLRALTPVLLVLPLFAALSPRPEPRTFSGYYTVGWEEQSFRPCDNGGVRMRGAERWWVSDAGPALARYRELVPVEYGTIFVTVRADVTDEGMFGHMGMYKRAMAFRELTEARVPTRERDDCTRGRSSAD